MYVQRGFCHLDVVKYFVSRYNKSFENIAVSKYFGSKSRLNSGNEVVRFKCILNFQYSLQETKAYNIQNYSFTCCFVCCETLSLALIEDRRLRVF